MTILCYTKKLEGGVLISETRGVLITYLLDRSRVVLLAMSLQLLLALFQQVTVELITLSNYSSWCYAPTRHCIHSAMTVYDRIW